MTPSVKATALTLSSSERLASLPDAPTIADLGYPGFFP